MTRLSPRDIESIGNLECLAPLMPYDGAAFRADALRYRADQLAHLGEILADAAIRLGESGLPMSADQRHEMRCIVGAMEDFIAAPLRALADEIDEGAENDWPDRRRA